MEFEGVVWLVFQDAKFCASREGGWVLAGMYQIGIGDRLTIFDDDDAVLWSGVIAPRKKGLFKLQYVPPNDDTWSPEGISHEQWMAWFQRKPALTATYEPAPIK
jgi:hypothetical protein